jgi:hypothetical protein
LGISAGEKREFFLSGVLLEEHRVPMAVTKGFMKKSLLLLSSVIAINAGTFVTNPESLGNRSLAASPRAQEEFPALTRGQIEAWSGGQSIKSFVAFSPAPPRVREQFPELERPFRARHIKTPPDGVTGRGIAANPRALEENPALARTARSPEFQIAPLK